MGCLWCRESKREHWLPQRLEVLVPRVLDVAREPVHGWDDVLRCRDCGSVWVFRVQWLEVPEHARDNDPHGTAGIWGSFDGTAERLPPEVARLLEEPSPAGLGSLEQTGALPATLLARYRGLVDEG